MASLDDIFKMDCAYLSTFTTHYLLRYEEKTCSNSCIFIDGDQARLESAATLEAYVIIQVTQNEIIKREITHFGFF